MPRTTISVDVIQKVKPNVHGLDGRAAVKTVQQTVAMKTGKQVAAMKTGQQVQ